MACDALVAWEHGLRALADGCAGRLLVVNIGSNVGDFDASRLNDMCESGRRALWAVECNWMCSTRIPDG